MTRRAWLGFVVALSALAMGYLVGPRVADLDQRHYSIGNVELPGPFGIGLNCDSPVFMALAREPSGLLSPNSSRQTRPGLILLAAALRAPLALFAEARRPLSRPPPNAFSYDPGRISAAFRADLPAYVAYTLLNFAFLLGTFACLLGIVRPLLRPDAATTLIVVSVGVLLLANDVTKAFLWSPHTQLLNILGPVFAVYCAARVLDGALARTRIALG